MEAGGRQGPAGERLVPTTAWPPPRRPFQPAAPRTAAAPTTWPAQHWAARKRRRLRELPGRFTALPFAAALTSGQLWRHEGKIQAGSNCPPTVLGTYTGIPSPAEEMPTSSSRHDYQRARSCRSFVLTNFPKLYKCLISIACVQNVASGCVWAVVYKPEMC